MTMAIEINWGEVALYFKERGLDVSQNVCLHKASRWKIGGYAKVVVYPRSSKDIQIIVRYCLNNDIPSLAIGDTSNLLFDNDGVNAVLIKIGQNMADFKAESELLCAESGAWVPALARYSASKGLSGLEHVIGIPGTIGGLACMNGGSQRKGISESIVEIEAVLPNGNIHVFSNSECGFSYRESIFQSNKAIVTQVKMLLGRGDVSFIRREMLGILKSRRLKFPLKQPNCGSVFVSNPKMYDLIGPPGFAIESIGLKGFSIGGAKISNAHANFFINTGNATSGEMLKLINFVRSAVYDKTGFYMNSEVKYVRPDGSIIAICDQIDD